MAEHVRVCKREYESLGGGAGDETSFIDEIDPHEDHIDVRGAFLQPDSPAVADEVVHWTRDPSNRMTFKDSENTTKTLTELVAGSGGLTEVGHRTLRQLIHFISDGPAEGFATGAYREMTGAVFPTAVIWWEASSKLKKIVERLITWTGANATTDQWKVYDTDGTTVLWVVTDTISYTGPFEDSRTRAIAAGP